MKTNKIFTSLAAVALMMGAWSCDEKTEYTPAPAYTGNEVYFSVNEASTVDIPQGATEVSVALCRINDAEELVVGLEGEVTLDSVALPNVFSVPTQVTFPAGQKVVQIPIGVVFSDITPEAKYQLNIKVSGEDHTPYGLTARTFTLVNSPWTEYKRFGGNAGFSTVTMALFGISDQELPTYKCTSRIDKRVKYQLGDADCPELQPNEKDQYCFADYAAGEPCNAVLTVDEGVVLESKTSNKKYNRAFLEPTFVTDNEGIGKIYVTDVYTYVTQINPAAAGSTPASNFLNMSLFNPETGLFSLSTIYFTYEGRLWQQEDYYQLPGYKSYTLDFKYVGNFVNAETGQESISVEAYKSEDVKYYVAKMVEGELSGDAATAALAKLAADDNATQVQDALKTYTYYLRKPGKYTMLGIAYNDAKEKVVEKVYTFDYKSVYPGNWKSIGLAEYTDGFFYPAIKGMPESTYDVEVEVDLTRPGYIRLVNPYMSGNGWAGASEKYDLLGNYYVELNISNPTQVYVPECKTGVDTGNGQYMVYSKAAQEMALGTSATVISKRKLFGKMDENQVITFPANTLLIKTAGEATWTAANTKGTFYLDLGDMDLTGKAAAPAKKAVTIKGKTVKVNLLERSSYKLRKF